MACRSTPTTNGTLRCVAEWMTAKAMREIGVMMTGGSSSVKELWLPMRQAGGDKRIRVDRVVAVVDCGLAVNPNLIARAEPTLTPALSRKRERESAFHAPRAARSAVSN